MSEDSLKFAVVCMFYFFSFFLSFFFLFVLVTLITFALPICLLVWVWGGKLICTNAPSRPRFVSKSVPVSIQMEPTPHSLHLPSLFCLALAPLAIAPTPLCLSTRQICLGESKRERESTGYYLMRSGSARRMLFTVTKQTGTPLYRKGGLLGFSHIFLLFLSRHDCHPHLNNRHFTETVIVLLVWKHLSFPSAGAAKPCGFEGYF